MLILSYGECFAVAGLSFMFGICLGALIADVLEGRK